MSEDQNNNNSSHGKWSLHGKVAIVTGSTQGLGEAIVRLFAEREIKGVIITGRNIERGQAVAAEITNNSSNSNRNEKGRSKTEAYFVQADLSKIEDVEKIVQAADNYFGRLDILVNSAALTERCSIWDTTPEQYDRIMNINTRAPFFLMQGAVRLMERENIAGSIINISSKASFGGMPMIVPYSISKGALNVATKSFAYSTAWSKIRVNAIAIGWMDTPGEDDVQRRQHTDGKDWLPDAEKQQPFGRLLKTDEVARCVAFCASEESGMMTGAVIDFDQSVWGAGPQPVPSPKEQWARAVGMEFSFPPQSSSPSSTTKK
mmetsp:Transcript_10199/g.24519  ORF Transcript_10199/g.24519 Transcript_10199/m.24519 type:complete len:318 (-) Transcript_10199:111-1064(-)